MELFEAIGKRHSYRGSFLPEKVGREDLRRMVEAGIMAPSGYNGQTTSFAVVDDPELIAELGRITGKDLIGSAPALIVLLMDGRGVPGQDFRFGVEDYAAAAENLLLAVTALGYATVWIDGALRKEGRAERIRAALGAEEGLEVRVVLPIGRPAELREQKPKKSFEERAWFNRRS